MARPSSDRRDILIPRLRGLTFSPGLERSYPPGLESPGYLAYPLAVHPLPDRRDILVPRLQGLAFSPGLESPGYLSSSRTVHP